jgi:hypothetical protein
MTTARYPIGAEVVVTASGDEHDGQKGIVVHHGRDSVGIYSRVRFADGQEMAYHRAALALAEGR